MISKSKIARINSPAVQSRRDAIEGRLSSIPKMVPELRRLLTTEGFVDYYLEMQDLYITQQDAYERLEELYMSITGKRRYAEFGSFRKVLARYLERVKPPPGL